MLNTQVTENGIAVTDDSGNEVGVIHYKSGFWVADCKLDIRFFKSMKAAEYYMLEAYLEHTSSQEA